MEERSGGRQYAEAGRGRDVRGAVLPLDAGTRQPGDGAGSRETEDESGLRDDGGLRHFFLLGLNGKGRALR